ncbi:MAG: hypothetical protein SAL70_15135 [Scytonema sp. PMC 1070.18]|nr:hypothetical protein [Scytonema sp. PMC 1070.18]
MNLYFLVEGKSTEKKVYPAWLAHLLPELQQVNNYDEVHKNNYYLFTANGYPSIIYKHLPNAIEDIRAIGKYNYCIVCLDAEENNGSDIQEEILNFLRDRSIQMENTKLEIIIQNRCIETWFLGNSKIYLKNPQSQPLLEYTRYYNVSTNCPELMGKFCENTHAQFHEAYLKELFRAKSINYSKNKPGDVIKPYYLEQLLKRTQNQPKHLLSFQKFIRLCKKIKEQL